MREDPVVIVVRAGSLLEVPASMLGEPGIEFGRERRGFKATLLDRARAALRLLLIR
ncbi:MAG: hypothetical protein ACREPA_05515 [Candidatus Dormibacteraceae bacterium]